MKRPEGALNREQARLILKKVISVCGGLSPIVRKPLADEARRLWRALGVTDPIPSVEETAHRRRGLCD